MGFVPERKHFMTDAQKKSLGHLPRYHWYCIEKTGGEGKGVSRPGKTAKDRALKGSTSDMAKYLKN